MVPEKTIAQKQLFTPFNVVAGIIIIIGIILTVLRFTKGIGAVTNLDNNKSVKVKVNDRGPFSKKKLIDLSYAAAKKIGLIKTGIAKVRIDIIK